ncbi:hypothetical protein QMK19_19260 [Streptomyces sp. H10-C2]|uniref:hypothetical protein n=1 Tax=unclassified Streptomyces TaxID=2593676 RepID=UPI0024BAD1E6|nr:MULTISPECIES: hypothetical protein [unclassified Streptomyces]MDJ0346245.1 hypothetical protein [Streptomyces sp. PH10-H1]MDJ0371760.1 hypothetical protein [Streptomyces sp. H10-C2]
MLLQVSRYGPLAAAYAVFQSLVGVLPDYLSGDVARYLLAGSAGLSAGALVLLSALLARSRAEQRTAAQALPGAGVDRSPGSLAPIMTGAAEALLRSRSAVDDPQKGLLTGWSHFLEEGEAGQRPTAIGTAYGLHIVLTLGRTDGLLDASALVDTLWRLRLPDGGWAARTGTGVSRPEVTALVLGALSRAGADSSRIADAVGALERMLDSGEDPEGFSRTYVVATVIRGLLRAAPRSPALVRLRSELVAGGVTDPENEGLLCWGHSLRTGTSSRYQSLPSPAHTAHAVLALSRMSRVLGEEGRSRHAREQGIEWLIRNERIEPQTEHLRRPPSPPAQGVDHAMISHFTAGWVAKALMSAGPDVAQAGPVAAERLRSRLEAAVAEVHALQKDGVWEWKNDRESQPLWMTCQGLAVLWSWALCGSGVNQ